MLSVSHQDFDLFRGVPLTFVDNLLHDVETQIKIVNVIESKTILCVFKNTDYVRYVKEISEPAKF